MSDLASQYDYDNTFNEYQSQISEWKDSASRLYNSFASGDLGQVFRTAAETVGTPVGVELLRSGLSNFGNKGAKAAQSLKKAASDKLDSLKAQKSEVSGESAESPANPDILDEGSSGTQDLQQLRSDAQDQLRSLGRDDLADNIGDPAVQQEAMGVLKTAGDPESAELFERMDGVARQRWPADPYAQPEETAESNFPVDTDIEMQDFVSQSAEAGSRAAIPEVSDLVDTAGTQARSFISSAIGRVANIRQVITDGIGSLDESPLVSRATGLADEATSRLSGLQGQLSRLADPDTAGMMPGSDSTIARALGAGQDVEQQISSNVQAVQRVTGISDSTEALQATEGLTKLTPEVLSTEEGLTGTTSGLAAGLEATGETLAETTGAETDGIGAIVGGVLALGGVLASIFAPSHSEQAPPVAIPNFSRPVLQLGLGG